jgi:hypothetical protein
MGTENKNTKGKAKDVILTAEDFLTRGKKLPREKVEIPELDGHVFVITMNGAVRDEWEYHTFIKGREKEVEKTGKAVVDEANMKNMRASLAAICTVDENDKRLFTIEQMLELTKVNAKILDRIFTVAQRLNGLGKGDLELKTKN